MHHSILYFISYFVLGLIMGGFIVYTMMNRKQKALKKQYEKTSIGADDSELRVKTLENKVKTLEAALEKSLKNNLK